jgi:hypothetical protein
VVQGWKRGRRQSRLKRAHKTTAAKKMKEEQMRRCDP